MYLLKTLFPHSKRRSSLLIKNKSQIQSSVSKLFPSLMATLRNKKTLAAVSRETPEGTRNNRALNTLDPELTHDYISQVSEKIEGRVTKKLSKEFSRTESRILGALSKLDEFLLNSQVRTRSVAVPGTIIQKTGKPREIVPQTIPAPKRGTFLTTPVILTAQRQKPILTIYYGTRRPATTGIISAFSISTRWFLEGWKRFFNKYSSANFIIFPSLKTFWFLQIQGTMS